VAVAAVEVTDISGADWLAEVEGDMFDPRPVLQAEAARRIEKTGRLMLFYSGAVWNSGGGGQRPQQLAEGFNDEACVIHLNSLDSDHLEYPFKGPLVAEVPGWDQWGEAKHKVLYAGIPDEYSVQMAEELGDDWFVWYDCLDDWRGFEKLPTGQGITWYDRGHEKQLLARADLVTCTADVLAEHVRSIAGRRPPPIKVVYNSTRLVGQPLHRGPRDMDCVMVGALGYDWIDWGALRELAQRHSLLLVGNEPDTGHPFDHPNLEWTGQVDNTKLLRVLSRAKVGLVPFRDLPLVAAVYPIKYCDYLAAGMPTVATHLPELVGKPYASVAWDRHGFIRAVEEELRSRQPRRAIMAEARNNTVEQRIAQIKPHLGGIFR